MGFLEDLGETLSFPDSVKYQQKLKKDGIQQFLHLSKKYLNYKYEDMHQKIQQTPTKQVDELSSCDSSEASNNKIVYWGDEIESHLIVFDDVNKKVYIQPNQKDFKEKLAKADLPFEVHAEYGGWMLETVPKSAYPTVCRYGDMIKNIRARTRGVKELLKENEYQLITPTFPLLGARNNHAQFVDYEDNSPEFQNKVTQSLFIDDRLINQHPRFPTLTENIRLRRQEKVNIQVPLYIDKNTSTEVTEQEPYKGQIYMDAMAFGMGSCCLQTTFSAMDFTHARWLYDQLSIVSPIFLSLTAGSSIFKGKLADIDTRWDIIAGAVDDRSKAERDINSKQYIPKSRYESISLYISDDKRNLPEYNDYKFPVNEELIEYGKQYSKEIGIEFDEKYWQHLGFLFSRDALVIFKNDIEQKNDEVTSHFENIQSTNWNSVRLKLPPSFQSHIGWRVEFRTTEVSLTDDENAAISMLVHILVRFLYEDAFNLNFYIPMELAEKNFRKSRNRDAILKEKFYFRTNIYDSGAPVIKEMTIYEIFFGQEEYNFPGIYGIYKQFKDFVNSSEGKAFCCSAHVEKVFDYVRQKCTGKIKTLARYQRDFVLQHPEYKQNSIVTDTIGYDLTKKLVDISYGKIQDPNFPKLFPDCIFNKNPSTFKYEKQQQKSNSSLDSSSDNDNDKKVKQKKIDETIQQNNNIVKN